VCGIAGFLTHDRILPAQLSAIGEAMARAIAHRGPDDAGVWIDGDAGVVLGHRRLSVLDLSPAGHQPMISASRRFVVVFNGEIYNHRRLRAELGDHPWRGQSDTETLLACVERWGLLATLKKSTGMFALVLWDRQNRELTLARDRMGEKPLYCGWQGATFMFASELKALRAHPKFQGEIEQAALPLYLRHLAVPAPYSIYRGIHKVVPGTAITISSRSGPGSIPEPAAYWSLQETVVAGHARPFSGDDHEALSELEERLAEAVSLQRVADVPLGAFLSGGVDSSAVVAMMQVQSSRPVRTFTIGFHESAYNEAPYAKAVARHLGTDHNELYVTPKESMDVISRLPELYDEPFADSSQIPTYLVAQLARQHVTVSLSGDGGDELFGGYGRYFSATRLMRKIRSLPAGGRKIIARGIQWLSPELLGSLLDRILLLRHGSRQSSADRLHALAEVLECRHAERIYGLMISHWRDPLKTCKGEKGFPSIYDTRERWFHIDAFEECMMYADALSYLPDDILVKVDRAAMAVSLETRIPMLDHRIVEFAWHLPLHFKMRNGKGKWLLRQLLYKYVPEKLVNRGKKGFGVPIDHWLRGPLREWAEELLAEDRLEREGFFYPKPIRRRWEQHVSGQCNWRDSLWAILMFQAWLAARQSKTQAI
jgi:asparagine synthase (glutamine-hydrolysing)